ncbi:MAG: Zn-dependent alcohol dehydrogenase [Acidimicrobiia bacterium]|nr:Zn-dependent alcohol dehydrogenase [Acidimicrobiia bacterium]
MKAAVLNTVPGRLDIEDIDIDSPAPREVLIETRAAGLCHSDLHFMEGSYPHPCPTVLGHESAGVVLEVGSDVDYVQPGDHVITCLSAFCGYCQRCLAGFPSTCLNKNTELVRKPGRPPRLSRSGDEVHHFLHLSSFAEQMLVHEHALVKVSKDMPFDKAALIGCGVTTGLGAVFRTAKVEPGSTVVVVGCGGIGLSAVQGARIAGANKVIAVDMLPSKLELAQALGATHVVNAGKTDAVAEVMATTDGLGVPYAFEAVGTKTTAEQCFKMLGRGGKAVVIGLIPVGTMIEVHGVELIDEKTLTGSNMGSNQFRTDMPRFVDMYLDGRLKLDEMVSQHITLDQINEGFDDMKTGNVARSVILF